MRRLVIPVALALVLTLAPYVRRDLPGRRPTAGVVVGSRDRTLPGKARRRARREGDR